MMAEPTLGARIMDAANAYAAAISEQVVALDRGAWQVAHADAVTEAMDRLRALAARADAAERLAVAADVLGWTCEADGMDGAGAFLEALAAWRAIDKGVTG